MSKKAKSFSILSRGTTISGITKKTLKEIRIPIPSVHEQQKIADILSTWDRTIESLEKLIDAKQRLKKGLMQQLLTGTMRFPKFGEPVNNEGEIPFRWKLLKIKNIALLKAGGTPSTSNQEYWNGDIPWMNSGDLNRKTITEVEGRITDLGLKNSNTSIIPPHSVLIGLAGQGKTRGTAAINEISLCTNQSIATLILDPKRANYMFVYHNLDFRYSELRRLSVGDGGRGGLNLRIIGNLSIKLPPIEEQK